MGTVGLNQLKTANDQDYETAVVQMSKIEEGIGLSLAKNSQLTGLAARIQKCSEVADYGGSSSAVKGKVSSGVGKIGGALSFQQGWGTLGGSVNAVMNQIESTTDCKTEYSISHTAGHPYFPQGVKKPEFDKVIPEEEKNDPKYVKSNPNAARTASNLLIQVSQEFGNQAQSMFTLASFNVTDPLEGQRNAAIQTTIGLMGRNEKMNGMLGALLDITLDKHSSGDDANYVALGNNPANPNENSWINDTVSVAKPIVSGPSGHTLRYLNFWAEKRDVKRVGQPGSHQSVSVIPQDWPSLQAARLVMMADLMPPKHHSYDEIMTSSIGITDGVSAPLEYVSKSSYWDLAIQGESDAHDIALQAFKDSEAGSISANVVLDSGLAKKQEAVNPLAVTDLTKMKWVDSSSEQVEARIGRAQAVDARNVEGNKISADAYNAAIDRAIDEVRGLPNADAIIEILTAAKRSVQS